MTGDFLIRSELAVTGKYVLKINNPREAEAEFTEPSYDVIVLACEISEFQPKELNNMFVKVDDHLSPDGIFLGAEKIVAPEEVTIENIVPILKLYFPFTAIKIVNGWCVWKCAKNEQRLKASSWSMY